jgi:hypothetical protein
MLFEISIGNQLGHFFVGKFVSFSGKNIGSIGIPG